MDDLLTITNELKDYSSHFISSKIKRLNNKLSVAISKLDNDKIIELIKKKKNILNDPRRLNQLLYKLFTIASINELSSMQKHIKDGLELINKMPKRIEEYEDLEHRLLVSSQNNNREEALSLFRDYIAKEGSIVRLFKYGIAVAKRCKKAGSKLEVNLSRRGFVKQLAFGSVAYFVLSGIDPFKAFAGGKSTGEPEVTRIYPWDKVAYNRNQMSNAKNIALFNNKNWINLYFNDNNKLSYEFPHHSKFKEVMRLVSDQNYSNGELSHVLLNSNNQLVMGIFSEKFGIDIKNKKIFVCYLNLKPKLLNKLLKYADKRY